MKSSPITISLHTDLTNHQNQPYEHSRTKPKRLNAL